MAARESVVELLNQIDQSNSRANLGYWVRPSATGPGGATAAVQRARSWSCEHAALTTFAAVGGWRDNESPRLKCSRWADGIWISKVAGSSRLRSERLLQ